jgi:RIO kinase 1
VERHNPLKASAISRKTDALRGDRSRKVAFSELRLEEVREDAINFGLATEVLYQMSAGKEASIFLAKWKSHPIILKAYRLWQSSHRMSMSKGYINTGGKRSHNILSMMEELAMKEHQILHHCFRAGIRVPTPIGRVANFLTMRFVGDGIEPASQLREVTLDNPEHVMNQVFDDYLTMYRDAHYVHGDLSGYNILWWKDKPWIIDVPQAYKVGAWADMKRVELMLLRDIKNVLSYFEQYEIYREPESILEVFLDEYIPQNLRHYRELSREGAELV